MGRASFGEDKKSSGEGCGDGCKQCEGPWCHRFIYLKRLKW